MQGTWVMNPVRPFARCTAQPHNGRATVQTGHCPCQAIYQLHCTASQRGLSAASTHAQSRLLDRHERFVHECLRQAAGTQAHTPSALCPPLLSSSAASCTCPGQDIALPALHARGRSMPASTYAVTHDSPTGSSPHSAYLSAAKPLLSCSSATFVLHTHGVQPHPGASLTAHSQALRLPFRPHTRTSKPWQQPVTS